MKGSETKVSLKNTDVLIDYTVVLVKQRDSGGGGESGGESGGHSSGRGGPTSRLVMHGYQISSGWLCGILYISIFYILVYSSTEMFCFFERIV